MVVSKLLPWGVSITTICWCNMKDLGWSCDIPISYPLMLPQPLWSLWGKKQEGFMRAVEKKDFPRRAKQKGGKKAVNPKLSVILQHMCHSFIHLFSHHISSSFVAFLQLWLVHDFKERQGTVCYFPLCFWKCKLERLISWNNLCEIVRCLHSFSARRLRDIWQTQNQLVQNSFVNGIWNLNVSFLVKWNYSI